MIIVDGISNLYAAQNLGVGLLHQWEFKERSGLNLLDKIGSNSGSLGNMVGDEWIDFVGERGIEFDKSLSQNIDCGSFTIPEKLNQFTASCICEFTAITSGVNQDVMGTTSNEFFNFFYHTSNSFRARLRTTTGLTSMNTPFTPLVGVKYHLFLTYDNVTLKFYVNKNLEVSAAKTGYMTLQSPANMWFGSRAGSNYSSVKVSDGRIYKRVLTDDERDTIAGWAGI